MKNPAKWIGALAGALLLVGVAAAGAETGDATPVLRPADAEPVAVVPAPDCGLAAEPAALDLHASATPASDLLPSYICVGPGMCNGGDGCSPPTRCGMEACGFPGPLTCTLHTECVTDCQAGSCANIGSCP